jgi:hypothetical protein
MRHDQNVSGVSDATENKTTGRGKDLDFASGRMLAEVDSTRRH